MEVTSASKINEDGYIVVESKDFEDMVFTALSRIFHLHQADR